jgi:hypothetical protein
MRQSIEFSSINRAILNDFENTLRSWLPNGKKINHEWCVGSLSGESGASLKINLKSGKWKDFAQGQSGGDPISLYAAIHNLKQLEAASRLAGTVNLSTSAFPPKKRTLSNDAKNLRQITAPDCDLSVPDFIPHTARYAYRSVNGKIRGYILRIEPSHGKKSFCPYTPWNDDSGAVIWLKKGFEKPRPLYNLHLLADADLAAPILIVEGEKCADAYGELGTNTVVTTWPGGSESIKHVDWAPIENRTVILWPDADEAGHRCMTAIAKTLGLLGCSIRLVSPPSEAPQGWDLADAINHDNWTKEMVQDCLERSQHFHFPTENSNSYELRDDSNGSFVFSDEYAALNGLVERAASDPGAPYTQNVIDALILLKRNDLSEFERLRMRLKKIGCRVAPIDGKINDQTGGCRSEGQIAIILELASAAHVFTDGEDGFFADLEINGHRETWAIDSDGFQRWLSKIYYEKTQSAFGRDHLSSVLATLKAKALHGSQNQHKVSLRVGEFDGRLYFDLCDSAWRAIEIDHDGWRVVTSPPIRFRRTAGMQPLPIPEKGGSIDTFRQFLNVKSDSDFVLVVAWCLAVIRARGPYPVLAISGEQGSAKSTFSWILRSLLDPNRAPLRSLPRDEHEFFIAANNGQVLAFDNVSNISNWVSDTVCRIATGGGFSVRKLYSDFDEVLFNATRPVLLNGIEDVITRPDLADRAIFITLQAIPEENRRLESEVKFTFMAERPGILGALFDAVSHGLKQHTRPKPKKLPRLAEFANWVIACEDFLFEPGTFEAAYSSNRQDAVNQVIEADVIATAICALMKERDQWEGTATQLENVLGKVVEEKILKSKSWPDSPRTLAQRLRRSATVLRTSGVDIQFRRDGRAKTRTISIRSTTTNENITVPTVPTVAKTTLPIGKSNPLHADGTDGADAHLVNLVPNFNERADISESSADSGNCPF